jgi:hypothetical protein
VQSTFFSYVFETRSHIFNVTNHKSQSQIYDCGSQTQMRHGNAPICGHPLLGITNICDLLWVGTNVSHKYYVCRIPYISKRPAKLPPPLPSWQPLACYCRRQDRRALPPPCRRCRRRRHHRRTANTAAALPPAAALPSTRCRRIAAAANLLPTPPIRSSTMSLTTLILCQIVLKYMI